MFVPASTYCRTRFCLTCPTRNANWWNRSRVTASSDLSRIRRASRGCRRSDLLTTFAVVTDDIAARVPKRTLNDGLEVPSIGLGTWPLRGEAGIDAMRNAIGSGYRLIDAAFNYDNEGAVGEAVRRSGVPRDELIVTSSLPGRFHGYQAAIAAIEESVLRTGLDHIDLYLIHWPNPQQDVYVEAWRALIAGRDRGLLRSIGTSNFLPEHLTRLINETGVTPSVNQIELHPYFSQADQRAFDAEHGIVDESWSPPHVRETSSTSRR